MVATVGSIAVDLTVNGAAFEAGFKKAGTTVERESSRMAKAAAAAQRSLAGMAGAFKSFGAGLAGGAAFAGLTSITGLLNSAREAVNKLDDIADRAKTTGLGTDLFQSMEITAKKAGVEINSLNGGLQTFAKNVGLAEQGTGRMFSQLEKLNPALLANILAAKDQEERLKLVADAFDRTSDATERAALSQAAFGDVDFSRLLEGGGAGLEAALQANKAADLIHGEEQIKKAGTYADALDDISDKIDKDLTDALINLTPAIVGVNKLFAAGTQEVADFAADVEKLGGATRRFVEDPSVETLLDMLVGEKGKGNLLRDLIPERTVADVIADIAAIRAEIVDLEATIARVEASGNELDLLNIDDDREELSRLNEELARLQAELDKVNAEPIKDIGDEADIAGDKVEKLIAGVTRLGGVNLALPPGGGSNVSYPEVTAPPTSITLPPSLFPSNFPDYGFASGGMIHGGDSQPVQFFKSPNEAVGVFTPSQMDAIGDAMGGTTVNMGGITVNVPPGTSPMSPQSQLALLDAVERRVRQALSRP